MKNLPANYGIRTLQICNVFIVRPLNYNKVSSLLKLDTYGSHLCKNKYKEAEELVSGKGACH